VPVITLSDRERDLIRLLALGHTDLTAARNLRISARSVTNVLRVLMDRLGVENRFQLGLTLGAMRIAVPPSLDSPHAEQAPLAEAS
jgi:DNA-binding NarL/FixJ family response regulator